MALFFPGGGLSAESGAGAGVVAAAAAATWSLQAMLPVLTHIAAFPVIHYAWRIRAYRALAAVLNSFVVSVQYHLCQGWPLTACLGLSVTTYRLNDYIWSPYVMAVGAEFVLRLYVYPWASLVSLPYLALIVFSTLANPFTIQTQLLILVVAVLLLFVKTAFLDLDSPTQPLIDVGANHALSANASPRPLRIDVPHRFHVPSLLLGVALMAVSLLGFFMEESTTYWLTHALLWHVPIYLALYFIMIGTTRDVRGWYDPIAAVLHWRGHARDDAESAWHTKRDSDLLIDPVVVYSAHDAIDTGYAEHGAGVARTPGPRSAAAAAATTRTMGTDYTTSSTSMRAHQRRRSGPRTMAAPMITTAASAPLFRNAAGPDTYRGSVFRK
jgi:hypothetical protein